MKLSTLPDAAVAGIALVAAGVCCLGPLLLVATGLSLGSLLALGARFVVPTAVAAFLLLVSALAFAICKRSCRTEPRGEGLINTRSADR